MKQLIIVAGPTAVGKTAYAIRLARQLETEIVSCDSRQFYRELRIGVARPSPEELSAAVHHFIAIRSVENPFNIYDYAKEAIAVIEGLFSTHEYVIAVGGSGLYIEALRHAPIELPSPTQELRDHLQQMPIEDKRRQLRMLDPEYYARVDIRNPVRLQRALEVCLMAGRPYSSIIEEHRPEKRPFDVKLVQLTMESTNLRQRINDRVDEMVRNGLLDEVQSMLQYRHLPTLHTVGYQELFPVIDGVEHLNDAVAKIKLNTWHYARKQMSWLRRYGTEQHVQ